MGGEIKRRTLIFNRELHRIFADLLGLSTKEFLFGIKEDKERFVKLILLNIFMNGDTQGAKKITLKLN